MTRARYPPWVQPVDKDPWGRNLKRVTDSRHWPSFHWSLLDREVLLSVAFGIAVLLLVGAGVRAILPDREPCAPDKCHNIAPIALAWSGERDAVALTYATCGSEHVQSVNVADAVSGELLWAAETDRATTRDVFVLGEVAQPYVELVRLTAPLSGRYTVSVQADEFHSTVFHTRELPDDGVLFNGVQMAEAEWLGNARNLGDCVFWSSTSGTTRTALLTIGILILAGGVAAWSAQRSIEET